MCLGNISTLRGAAARTPCLSGPHVEISVSSQSGGRIYLCNKQIRRSWFPRVQVQKPEVHDWLLILPETHHLHRTIYSSERKYQPLSTPNGEKY